MPTFGHINLLVVRVICMSVSEVCVCVCAGDSVSTLVGLRQGQRDEGSEVCPSCQGQHKGRQGHVTRVVGGGGTSPAQISLDLFNSDKYTSQL